MRKFGSLLILLLIGVAVVGGYSLSTASNAATRRAESVPTSTSTSAPGTAPLIPTDSPAQQAQATARALAEQTCPHGPGGRSPDWAYSAVDVNELTAEADVIIRGVVLAVHPTRAFTRPLVPGTRSPAYKVDVTPYTDSSLKVLHVYKGTVGAQITVTQWGGTLAATDQYPASDGFPYNDPRYTEKGEYILFLKLWPASEPGAPGHDTYMTVNPNGRYEIRGSVVCVRPYLGKEGYTYPYTLTDLLARIEQGEPPLATPFPTSSILPPTAAPAATPVPAYPRP